MTWNGDRNHWGLIPQFQVPAFIFDEHSSLQLNRAALSCYLVLLHRGRIQQKTHRRLTAANEFVVIRIPQRDLMLRVGLVRSGIANAIDELVQRRFLTVESSGRSRHGAFSTKSYVLTNAASGQALRANGGTNIPLMNRLRYFNLPNCIVTDRHQDWSLAKMTGSEARLYVALCWIANNRGTGKFSADRSAILRSTGLSRTTLDKAWRLIGMRRLVWFFPKTNNRIDIELCDPLTGEPVHEQVGDLRDDPANYFVTTPKGSRRRAVFNIRNPEAITTFLRASLPSGDMITEADGQIRISCPFHVENTPSCSVNPVMGCFFCFGCEEKGTISHLIAKLRGVSEAEAFRLTKESLNIAGDFKEPDRAAEAIYSYHAKDGREVKQVLRFPGKRFYQRRPDGARGWVANVDGVEPLLYRADLVQHASTVIVCEGEKDCDTVNGLGLYDGVGGQVIGTTSGGAQSWRDGLADDLRDKRVLIIPDADLAGERYASQIQTSLQARGIEHRIISLAEMGAKDISDFIAAGGTPDDVARLVGDGWLTTSSTVTDPIEFEQA